VSAAPAPDQSSFQALLSLLRYARGERPRILWASLCSVLNKLFDVLPEILIGIAIDVVVRRDASFIATLGVVDAFHQVLLLAALTILVWALESLFEFLHLVAWRNLAQSLQHDLRLDAYGHMQDLDMAWFEDASTGNLVAILNDDINQLERFLDGGANEILQVLTTVVVIGAIFFALAPSVAILAMAPMPFILWGSFAFTKRVAPRYAAVREQVGLLNGQLANNLGVLHSREGRFDRSASAYERALRLDPQNPTAHHNLARVLYRLGELDRALGHLKIAAAQCQDIDL